MNAVSFTIQLCGLTEEQAKWKPRTGRWTEKQLGFFRNWKHAPEDSFYHMIGKSVTEEARTKLKRDFCKWDGEPLGGLDGVIQIRHANGTEFRVDVEMRQYLTFDDFNDVPFTMCRIRITKTEPSKKNRCKSRGEQ